MATLQVLLERQAALECQIAEAKTTARSLALAEVQKLLHEDGLKPPDVAPGSAKRASAKRPVTTGRKVAPKSAATEEVQQAGG